MSFCEVKPPEQVWYDCEREGEQQSGMTQRDGPLSGAKPGDVGDSCEHRAPGGHPGAAIVQSSLHAGAARIG
jgi:hypothetical protein